jgi:TolA-binding protein
MAEFFGKPGSEAGYCLKGAPPASRARAVPEDGRTAERLEENAPERQHFIAAAPRRSPAEPVVTPRRPRLGPDRALLALALASALATSCAYYNTMYMARKYYFRATTGAPYVVDKNDSPDISTINKSMEYSKKLIANYPKSKWVDDAYLLWARGFLLKNDPIQCITMLEDFATHYPGSPMIAEALFYKGVAQRQARRYTDALTTFDEFLQKKGSRYLVPYAQLERSRALMSLDRPAEATVAATVILDRWPKSPLAVTARLARAQAEFDQGAFTKAREDYQYLGQRSRSDDERLDYLLREAECLESGRRFDEGLSLLHGALGHEHPPVLPDTTGGRPLVVQQTPGYDRYGRLLIRIGTLQLMAGKVNDALDAYRRVVAAYPKTPVAAEAQYRIGYAQEIGADDFEKARAEYAKVRDISPGSPFADQAQQRQNTLDQLVRFRSATGDSTDQRAEAGFLLAEQYLFQLDKPERALGEYRKIESTYKGTPWAGKAINAQAWVLRHKFDRPAAAESLLRRVVNEYPATEAQLAARDYLEGMGQEVTADLIQLPSPPRHTRADSLRADSIFVADSIRYALARPLTPPPVTTPPLGMRAGPQPDSLGRLLPPRPGLSLAHGAPDSSLVPGRPPGPGAAPPGGMFASNAALGPRSQGPGGPPAPSSTTPGVAPPPAASRPGVAPGVSPEAAASRAGATPAGPGTASPAPPPADTLRVRRPTAALDTTRFVGPGRFKPRGDRIQ